MSLGWQTESALLPSKSKAIHVNSKSLFSLKAIVYETEQRQKLQAKEKPVRSLNNTLNNKKESIKSDEKDDPDDLQDNNVKDPEIALTAKSKIYEQIMQGQVEGDASLVDFGTKRQKLSNDHIGDSLRKTASEVVNPSITSSYGKDQWQWSKGASETQNDDQQVASQWRKDEVATKLLQKEVDRQIEKEYSQQGPHLSGERIKSQTTKDNDNKTNTSTTSFSDTALSEGAKIKTQWEKTLNSSARGFLDKIHEETLASRSGASVVAATEGTQKSFREERLELIKRKREKLQSKSS